jgi:hypothetical protein
VAPDPERLRHVRTVVEAAGTLLFRGVRHRRAADALVPGTGDTRFATLPDTRHAYVSASRTAARLESALHELSGSNPTIHVAQLADWSLAEARLTAALRLFDLRDRELHRLGIARHQLVDTDPAHYRCTRRWAAALQHRHAGGHAVAGAMWHSRQADLHARSQSGGLAGDVLVHRTVEVAVVWSPPAPPRPFRRVGVPVPLLRDGRPVRLVQELAVLLGAPTF